MDENFETKVDKENATENTTESVAECADVSGTESTAECMAECMAESTAECMAESMAECKSEKKGRRWVLFLISLLILLAGASYLVFYFTETRGRQKDKHDIYEEMQEEKEKEPVVIEPEVPEEPIVIPIDFATLKQTNPHIYAWIDIEDTNIHYPIVQHPTDNSYYANRTIEGKQGLPGSIYTEFTNSLDFSDFNTLIYGHDMKNGTMFKHLHKFKNAEFFNSHDTVTIYTENAIKTYRIYAVVEYDDRHIMYSFDQTTTEGRLAYIQSLTQFNSWNNHYREGMTLTENDKLITLCTCITGQPTKRLIVVAAEVQNS